MAKAMQYEIEQFISDAHEILDRRGGPVKEALLEIGEKMKGLVARDDLEEIRDNSPNRRLYSEPEGLQLMLVTFSDITAVHTHGAWGVMVGYKGRERYTQWVREDDGSRPGYAKLQQADDKTVENGDIGIWLPPPNDIHRQWPEGGTSVELILMGNPPGSRRLYFDIENDSYHEGDMASNHYPSRTRTL